MKRENSNTLRVLCILALCVSGCSEVVVMGDSTILKFKFPTIAALGLGGLLLLVSGVVLCITRLPRQWRASCDNVHRRVRTLLLFLAIPVAGILLVVFVVPFAWYRIEVGPQQLRVSEFPEQLSLSRADLKTIAVIREAGGTGESRAARRARAAEQLLAIERSRRLQIVTTTERTFFINEAEIGTDSFEKIVNALSRFLGAPVIEEQ